MAKGSGSGGGAGGSAGGRRMVNASDVQRLAANPIDPIVRHELHDTDVGMVRDPPHMEFILAFTEGDIDRLKAVVDAMDNNDRESLSSTRLEGFAPLHWAAGSGMIEFCKYLVEQLGFDTNSVDTDLGSGMTPLFCAILNERELAVRYLLENGADPNMKHPVDGTTSLHRATFLGYDEIAQLLLAKGANVDEPSSMGSPLVVAAAHGKLSIMKILLEHQADPNKVSWKFGTPVTSTIYFCPGKIAESTCIKCVKLLVEAGADVNITNSMTPLEIATTKGLTSCVKYLLEVKTNDHDRRPGAASEYAEVKRSGDSTEKLTFKMIPGRRRLCKQMTREEAGSSCTMTDQGQVRNTGVTEVSNKKGPQKSISYEDATLDGWIEGKSYFVLEPVGKKIKDPFILSREVFKDLYGYQRDGVKWMWSLYCKSRGGILADDMGLGKTKQVSSFLAGMVVSNLVSRVLIVAPNIVLPGWEKELKEKIRIRTQVKSYASGDPKKEENLESILKDGGILLISYDMFRDHYELLSGDNQSCHVKDQWDYVILDEGHTIKNHSSKTSKIVEKIKCANKIIVSGTPIQNDLKEFYTLFKICCPTILGDKKYFADNFAKPIKNAQFKCASFAEQLRSATARKVLKNHTNAYILRRTKQELKEQNKLPKGLPNMTEFAVWLRLSPYQEALYRELLTNNSIKEKLKGAPLVTIAIMRKICYHPRLLDRQLFMEDLGKKENGLAETVSRMLLKLCPPPDESAANQEHSCKIAFLKSLMASFIKNSQRVLIFSQSRAMLDIIEGALSLHFEDEQIVRIDGTVKASDRIEIMNDFQENTTNPARIFLLTTQVGGVGITLTKASRVVIVDPSWNPSVDNQSVDRCYRIGKDANEDVVVYRLITIGTIEEKAYALQILKGTTSAGFNENKDIERYFTNKDAQKKLMSLPESFDVSLTKIQIEQNHEEEVHAEEDDDLRLCIQNFGIVDVTSHGKLFSKQAKPVPELHRQDIKSFKGSNAKKHVVDNVLDGGQYAFDPTLDLFKQPVKCLVGAVNKHAKEIESIQEEMKGLKKHIVVKGNRKGADQIQERFNDLEIKLKSLLSEI